MRVRYQAAPHPEKIFRKRSLVFQLSGWQDSNLRPPAPKAGAMTGLRYTPKQFQYLIKGCAKIGLNQKIANPLLGYFRLILKIFVH
jgi:hypothetical protein